MGQEIIMTLKPVTDGMAPEDSFEILARALFENYESIYEIDPDTHRYRCFCESEFCPKPQLAAEGEDFFAELSDMVERTITAEDREYVLRHMQKEALLSGTENEKTYSLVYRVDRCGRQIYHQLRAISHTAQGRRLILMGVRSVDQLIRQEAAHKEAIRAMRKEREEDLRKLEDALHMSRIHNFTSQMQPHFLYNALGSIQEIMLTDPEYASRLLGDFTVHLRSCVRAMTHDEPIPFSQELENIRAYANIEKMRFGNRLEMRYDIEAPDFFVPPLTIQPLVENAIRHGIYQRGRQGGTVTLRTWEDRPGFVIRVEDDGVGFNVKKMQRELAEGKRDSTGLQNITFRLEKLMGASVEIRSVPGRGTAVTVRIPRDRMQEGRKENESDHRGR